MPTRIHTQVRAASAAALAYLPAISALWIAAVSISAPMAQTHTQTVSVSPSQAESGQPFQVTLSGKSGLCAPIFTRHEVTVDAGVLNLSVMGVSNPAALCAVGEQEHEFHTDFNVPALKAGKYEVAARLLPACSYENPPCMPIRDPVEYGGILEARDSADMSFAIRPKRAAKDKAFELFVFGRNFTCGNEFSNLSFNVSGHSLNVSFTNRPHPEALCPAVLADHGPTFQLPAMASGVYQVFATAMPYCGTTGPCPLALVAPQLSGALTVGDGTVSLQRSIRQGAEEKPGVGMVSLSIDHRLGVRGWWHAAPVSLTGRRQ
ncbi:MAG: hypothetical protein ABIW76_01535 [Fibrobacteria bacterium]